MAIRNRRPLNKPIIVDVWNWYNSGQSRIHGPNHEFLSIKGVFILRGIKRCGIVDDDFYRDNFIKRLRQVGVGAGTAVYTWALLTNHAHIPIRSGPEDRGLIRSVIDRIDPVKTF